MDNFKLNPLKNMEPKKLFAEKHILLGITGGIAAYKSTEIIRQLVTLGSQVRVVLTEGGSQFITAETLRALSRAYRHLS